MIRRVLLAVWCFALTSASAFAQQPPTGQSEFVPARDLPAAENIPAAPLLVTAYAIIWVLVMFYLWTIWRRLNKVETEMRALEQRQHRGGTR
jgi:CcmD family protein